jgi:hypothetical protein
LLGACGEKSNNGDECRVIMAFYGDGGVFAIHQMVPMKALEPDGFDAYFIQKNWATVGMEVCKVILFSLNSGIINKELNSTYIALIPKS